MGDVQQLVQKAIDQAVESGAERGIQVAVYRDSEPLVDAIAGVADPSTGRLVSSDTPFYNFSIVKAAASTAAHPRGAGPLRVRHPGRGRVAGVRRPWEARRDRAARPEPFGGCSRHTVGHHAG